MQKTVVFDFDGTIADTEGLLLRSIEHVLGELSEEDIQAYKYMTDKEFMEYLGISSITGLFYYKKGKRFFRKHADELDIFPHVDVLVKRLAEKGRVGVLSKNERQTIESVLNRHGLKDVFSFVEHTSILSSKKKKLLEIQEEYGDIIYVGDQVEDVEAANHADCLSIGVSWGHHSKTFLQEANPTRVVSSVKGLEETIYSLCGRSSSSTSQDNT